MVSALHEKSNQTIHTYLPHDVRPYDRCQRKMQSVRRLANEWSLAKIYSNRHFFFLQMSVAHSSATDRCAFIVRTMTGSNGAHRHACNCYWARTRSVEHGRRANRVGVFRSLNRIDTVLEKDIEQWRLIANRSFSSNPSNAFARKRTSEPCALLTFRNKNSQLCARRRDVFLLCFLCDCDSTACNCMSSISDDRHE